MAVSKHRTTSASLAARYSSADASVGASLQTMASLDSSNKHNMDSTVLRSPVQFHTLKGHFNTINGSRHNFGYVKESGGW
mmetsp:Transcript_10327/g.24891  ORF Transcript_10327/g.24891 Transcript_10327/m.24891 type:complete len:80 (+) Transcript_10327:1254-1493(+)